MGAHIRAKNGTWGFAGKHFDEAGTYVEDEDVIEAARDGGYCEVTTKKPAEKKDTAPSGTMKTKDLAPEPEPESDPKPKKAAKPKADKAE